MKAWQLISFKSPLNLIDTKIPWIKSPTDMLIRVNAASINPIDSEMKDGYGRKTVEFMRKIFSFPLKPISTFPLILGRDFSGVVEDVGSNVKLYKPGDEVWGALGVQRQGSHAQYCIASSCSIAHRPKNLTDIEAASIPYVAMTVLSSLFYFSSKLIPNLYDKNVLIRGGAGGIGTFTIQLIKALGARLIVTTCSPDSFESLQALGADEAIDYHDPNIYETLKQWAPYDLIYDPVGGPEIKDYLTLLKPWSKSRYVCLSSPLLKYTDNYGIIPGFVASTVDFDLKAFQALLKGNLFTYGYFVPNHEALKFVGNLIEQEKLRPVIEKVIDFEEVPAAYEKVKLRKGRGKTVIRMPD